MMGWAIRWIGTLEWQLRLPNVLAHALYLAFGFLLMAELKNAATMLLGFALFNFDPFMLDFFSLARGYGLALGFSVMSLLFLRQAWKRSDLAPRTRYLFLSLTCASLADLANFSWLNFHLSIFGAAILVLLIRRDKLVLDLSGRALAAAMVLTVANAWFIRNLARRIWVLRQSDQLYGRGKVGFIPDTMGSLVDSYFYGQPHSQTTTSTILFVAIASFALVVMVVAFRASRDRRLSFSAVLLSALIVAVGAPIAEHYVLGVEYPIDRIALYYIPLVAALVMFLVDETMVQARRGAVIACSLASSLLFGAMAAHLSRTANAHHTLAWYYDADTKAAILDIHRYVVEHGGNRKYKVGNRWEFEPTLNFYRRTLLYDWMIPANRNGVAAPDNDLVFCQQEDLQNYPYPYSAVQRYPLTNTVLVSINRP
jgi:hypothetical protein